MSTTNPPCEGSRRFPPRAILTGDRAQRRSGAPTPPLGGFSGRDRHDRQRISQPYPQREASPASRHRPANRRTATAPLYLRREVSIVLKFFIAAQLSAVEAARRLREREEGQTMAEYGVVLAVITIAVVGAITLLSTNVRNAITSVAGLLPG